jgi:hypothetical protein
MKSKFEKEIIGSPYSKPWTLKDYTEFVNYITKHPEKISEDLWNIYKIHVDRRKKGLWLLQKTIVKLSEERRINLLKP